eukprot:gene26842-biopygen17431
MLGNRDRQLRFQLDSDREHSEH